MLLVGCWAEAAGKQYTKRSLRLGPASLTLLPVNNIKGAAASKERRISFSRARKNASGLLLFPHRRPSWSGTWAVLRAPIGPCRRWSLSDVCLSPQVSQLPRRSSSRLQRPAPQPVADPLRHLGGGALVESTAWTTPTRSRLNLFLPTPRCFSEALRALLIWRFA